MADGGHIRAGFYQAASNVCGVAELERTLFTHLIYVPSSPLRLLKANKLQLSEDDLRHVVTFAHFITPSPSSKALLALPYQPTAMASSIEIAREHHFDGIHFTLHAINVDFLQFCARWREAAAQESRLTSRRPLLLTASFSQWSPLLTLPNGVPLPLDWLCLCGYPSRSKGHAYSHVGTPFTFSHTALHDCKPHDTQSIHFRLRTCLDAGVDPSILVLGLAMHGLSFQLKDPSVHGMRAPCVPRGKQATCHVDRRPVMRQRLPRHSQFGTVAYRDVTHFIGEHKAKYCHDSTTQSAYCYVGTTWIAYDDTFTITQKVDYIKSMRLKGYALDSLDEDTSDWHLSNAARRALLSNVESKQMMNNSKGKEFKGKQKLQSRVRKEIIELGVNLSSYNVTCQPINASNTSSGASLYVKGSNA